MTTRLPLADDIQGSPPVPSVDEAKGRYYDLLSRPHFIARSSYDTWVIPTDLKINIGRRELRPVGKHPLCDVWEGKVDIAMHYYLVEQKVQYTSLDPVRLAIENEATAPVIVWVGVKLDTLSAERGVDIAVGLRGILLQNGIDDVHVELRAATITTFSKLYKPAPPDDPTAHVREPFSTSLGIPICAENTPDIQGTATLFFTVPSKPGRLFLLAPRHVLFRVDVDNLHYAYNGSGPRRNVLLLSTDGLDSRIHNIEKAVKDARMAVEHFERRLSIAKSQSDKAGRAFQLDEAESAMKELEKFLVEAKEDWKDPKNRIIGHIVLSPPLLHNAANGGLTQDFAVVEIDPTKINATNFIGNAIDLGTEMAKATLMEVMDQHQCSFNYPADRLIRFNNVLLVNEMVDPNPENMLVFKRGHGTELTIGRLNNVHSVLRRAFETRPGEFSREVAVLSRSRSAPFSDGGDSGAVVIDGWGAVAGMLTSGDGFGLASDCTYVTPIIFLLERLDALGFPANIFPTDAEIFV